MLNENNAVDVYRIPLNEGPRDPRDGTEPMARIMQRRGTPLDAYQDDPVDDNRAEQYQASAPALPFYLAEKYFWKQSGSGRFYLSPIPAYLKYVEEFAPRAANHGLGLVYPGGEIGVTHESKLVDTLIKNARETLETYRALKDQEAQAYERYLVDRCTRNAVYAASTQYELEQWAARATARDEDPSQHQNYGEKESRLEDFALLAGIHYAVAREVVTTVNFAEEFGKAARRIVYDSANFEGRRLLDPRQLDEQTQAGVEAAKLTARRF